MKLYLIDGSSLAYRGHFAFIKNPLINSKGENTSAVFGFLNSTLKLLKEEKPTHILVVFDAPGPTHRRKKFDQYKIQRPKMPEELRRQFPIIKEVLSALGITCYEQSGLEADDIIASLAKSVSEKGLEVIIFSGDKDFLQLLNQDVRILHPRDFKIYDRDSSKERIGVLPSQVVDFLALTGDSADNIPGVKGIGPKTAVPLLERFGSLDNIYANLDRIERERLRNLLLEQRESAYLSKELATLRTEEEIPLGIKAIERKELIKERLLALLSRLEFFSMIERLGLSPLSTYQELKAEDILTDRIDTVAVSSLSDTVAVATSSGVLLLRETGMLNKIIDRSLTVVTDNSKTIPLLDKKIFDIAIASYLLEPSLGNQSLPKASLKYLSRPLPSQTGDEKRSEIEKYLLSRAAILYSLYPFLRDELKSRKLERIYYDIELPLSKVLREMETRGVLLDLEFFSDTKREMKERLTTLERDIYSMAGIKFNINSPKQLSHILFDRLGLPKLKRTKTGTSTDHGVLIRLIGSHKIVELLLEYRETEKLRSTYIDAIPELVCKDGRVRTVWCQTSTSTGRLSSIEPNLQNIPDMVRKGFIAPSGFLLISADYSQIELRIVASLSGDESMKEAFEQGQDFHTRTAALILGIEEEDVDKKEREMAKAINFGIIYGMGAWGLSKRLGISVGDADSFISMYFRTYPGVKDWIDRTIREVTENGYTTTLLGRKRYFDTMKAPDVRAAINAPVQGSAADMIKLAMINLNKALSHKESGIIIQVHDELVLEVKESERTEVADLVKREMENAITLDVPVICDMKIGKNWGEMSGRLTHGKIRNQ